MKDEKAVYRIKVLGRIDLRRRCWFEPLEVQEEEDGVTVLVGWIEDQAALFGLLNRFRDLAIPLIGLERLMSNFSDHATEK